MSVGRRGQTLVIHFEELGKDRPGRVTVTAMGTARSYTMRLDNFHNVEQTLLDYLPEPIQELLEYFDALEEED